SGAPYPGDSISDLETYSPERFYVYRTRNKGKIEYAISDSTKNFELTVSWEMLRDPNFNMANWYANRLRTDADMTLDEFERPPQDLGDVVGEELIRTLEENG